MSFEAVIKSGRIPGMLLSMLGQEYGERKRLKRGNRRRNNACKPSCYKGKSGRMNIESNLG
jgi:hypothetical protein